MESYRLLKNMQEGMGKFLLGGLLALVLVGCGEDVDIFIPRATMYPPGDVRELQSHLREDLAGSWTYTVSCPCSGGAAFKVQEDLTLDIPKGFVDLGQYPCDSGFFTIHVEVLDSRGKVLAGGIPTVSDEALLESRLQCRIRLQDGGQTVRLAAGKAIRLLVNDPDPRERMELFYGGDQQWIQADGDPDSWANVEAADWYVPLYTGGFESGFGYACHSDSLDWVGLGVFFQVPKDQLSRVCIELPAEYNADNTVVFLVFKDYKSLLRLEDDPGSPRFCEPFNAAPAGFRATFVVLSQFGEDDYRFAARDAVLATDHVQYLEPRKTPYPEILQYLAGL